MWFKNLQLHRLSAPWSLSADDVEACLSKHAFYPGTQHGDADAGLGIAARERCPRARWEQMLLTMRAEKKLLPATVVNR